MSPEDDAVHRLPDSIELTRDEAGRVFGAMDDAIDALPAGPVRDELQAAKRLVIAKLWEWLGEQLGEGEEL